MKNPWLLVALLAASAIPAPAESELPPRLVRFTFEDESQVEALEKADADIAAHGKGWIDVMMPARELMGLASNARLAEAVAGLRSETIFEDAEAQMRAFSTQADLGVYHTLAEVKQELDATVAAHPGLASLHVIGRSHEGRDIWALRIASAAQDGIRPAFLFTGAHHAREWISIEVPMALIQKLVTGYGSDPDIKTLVDQRETWVVPVVNPDGVFYSQTQYKMWRKNRRPNEDGSFGVDPNRNYGYKWGGPGASPSPDSDTYRGPGPFSEPESQAIRDLTIAKKFVSAISFHSYSQLVLWPWGYTADPTPDVASFEKYGRGMAALNGYTPQQSIDLYPTTGDFDDYMYGDRGVLGFTIELGTQFVPPESEVAEIIRKNLNASLYLLREAAEPFPPLRHDSLTATTDAEGPYKVEASFRAGAGFELARLELVFRRAGASAEERTTMTAHGGGIHSGEIPGGALGEVVYHFELIASDGRTIRFPAQESFSFQVVDSLVLLISDAPGTSYDASYEAALAGLGRAYSVWSTKRSGSPSLATLRNASAVIWYTGDASSATLTETDQQNLGAHIAEGGKLVLFGQDIGYEIKATAFYRDVLKARYVADAAGSSALSGAAGTFAEGLSIRLGEGDGASQRYPEAIEPLEGASTLFTYDNGKIGAIQVGIGPGRVAYCGFGLEAVNGADRRQQVLGKALEWAVASAESNLARARLLEGAASAGEAGTGRALETTREEARKALHEAWGKGDDAQAKRYRDAEKVPATLEPVAREARRLLQFRDMARD